MARPRKDSEKRGAEARMIEAFWDQLSRMPYREVTAASVARQAGCNRATFYYYFDSIEDLDIDSMVEEINREQEQKKQDEEQQQRESLGKVGYSFTPSRL